MPPYNCYNGWLPSNPAVYNAFVDDLFKNARNCRDDHKAQSKPGTTTGPDATSALGAGHKEPVQKFGEAIKKNPLMVKLFNNIFKQASQSPDPDRQIQSFSNLLYLLDGIVDKPPKFQAPNPELESAPAEPIGVPMYLLFDILSNTAAAYDLFRMEEFNKALKNLLNSWGKYLQSADSASTLTTDDDGWFGKAGIEILQSAGRGFFDQTYVVPDPKAKHKGFTSWDHFFTREVQYNARPLQKSYRWKHRDFPVDMTRTIFNACESTVERWRSRVKAHDRFWLKGMPYSLYDMFNNENGVEKEIKEEAEKEAKGEAEKEGITDPEEIAKKIAEKIAAASDRILTARADAQEAAENAAKLFVGGTVYQAFLSPQDYHRWHSPIDGTIKAAYRVPGTYYAVLPDEGWFDDEIEASGALIRSQPWLTVAATRAVFIIEGSKHIGSVAFIAIGMCEVSTCELVRENGQPIKVGDEIKAGEQLGMFHFGGSSHAVVFNPGAKVQLLTPEAVEGEEGVVTKGRHIKVRRALGISLAE
ncbi:phosphatidylserine decarboxylase [Rhizoctonia solani]|uniref:Phosphatidylserine decarboxylase n=1 Tax=Rhizoctonia solani TaxID=456999 RepID=A0A0K6G7W7_9AGAM|nr:phosphatidylserine decarboxylase [Rhizoctonia solani]